MLEIINNALQQDSDRMACQATDTGMPIIFIVAQPRGASTLLQQLLLSNLDVGYISNFLAQFYKAPVAGLHLEKKVLDRGYKSHFTSAYGNTDNHNEPHEWGWFWKEMLGLSGDQHYKEEADLSRLVKNLQAITEFKQTPLLIDSVYALSNLALIKQQLPNVKVINLTRDLFYICNSIINARTSRYGDIHQFYGHPPKNIEYLKTITNPIEQIVLQVKSIQDEIDEIVNDFPAEDVLHIDYQNIYEDSLAVVQQFHGFLQQHGIELEYKDRHLPQLTYRNSPKLINHDYCEELDRYYTQYFRS